MVDYTHRYCKEWENPKGSSEPISYKTLLCKGFGYSEQEAEKGEDALRNQQRLIRVLYEADLK